jgi:type II secretory pathway pseudopilin PulG
VMVFLMLLALSVAAPKVAKEIQRDKEQEAVQRGLQYRRAIQLYYKKFGAYPSDMKQLEKSNEIRFLRKRYKDPITGQDDWRLIHMGEAKVPPMGFFGQPLQPGLSSASTGPGMGISGTPSIYAPSSDGNTSGTNAGANGGAANGSANGAATGTPNNPTNSGSSSFGFSNGGSNSGPSGIGSSGIGSSGGGFGFSNSNTGASTPGVGATPTGTNGPGASSSSSGSNFGGGPPIVGVGIPLKKDSMLQYHKQKKYSDWEFVYDPQQDLLMNAGGIANGGNVNGADANGNPAGTGTESGNSSTFGNFGSSGSNGNSGSGFGNFGNSGSGGSAPTNGPGMNMPNSPQQ